MKGFKITLIVIASLGIIASIFNIIYEKSFDDIETIVIGLIIIGIALNLEKVIRWYNNTIKKSK